MLPLVGLLVTTLIIPALQEPERFEIQKLTDGVYASIRREPVGLGVDANNVFIVDDDGIVVVDTNFGATSTRQVIAALKKISPKPVKYVVNTHWHDDHVLGNQAYRDAYPGVQFVAHEATREYLPGRGAAARKAQIQNLPGFAGALRDALAQKKNLAGASITDDEQAGYSSDLRMIEVVSRRRADVRRHPANYHREGPADTEAGRQNDRDHADRPRTHGGRHRRPSPGRGHCGDGGPRCVSRSRSSAAISRT